MGRTGCPGAALLAQNFAFHPEGGGESLRMVKQGRNAIKCVLESLLAAVECRGGQEAERLKAGRVARSESKNRR